jgi:hypothetical protein
MKDIETDTNLPHTDPPHRHVWDREYLLDLRTALAQLDRDGEHGDDDDMPKVDDARRIQQFKIDDKFQETFDAWAAEIEKKENGTLAIVFQETLHEGVTLLISYRIDPKPHIARPRR